jgi:hypothetical protein
MMTVKLKTGRSLDVYKQAKKNFFVVVDIFLFTHRIIVEQFSSMLLLPHAVYAYALCICKNYIDNNQGLIRLNDTLVILTQ